MRAIVLDHARDALAALDAQTGRGDAVAGAAVVAARDSLTTTFALLDGSATLPPREPLADLALTAELLKVPGATVEAASGLVTVPAGTRVDALVAAAGLSWQDAFDAQVAAEEYPTAEYLLATARSSALPAVDAELDPDVAQTLQTTAALGNAAALAGVTVLAAQACGVSDRKGRLAPGYDADLLAVDGDPLADLAALARPVAVLHQGVWVR